MPFHDRRGKPVLMPIVSMNKMSMNESVAASRPMPAARSGVGTLPAASGRPPERQAVSTRRELW